MGRLITLAQGNGIHLDDAVEKAKKHLGLRHGAYLFGMNAAGIFALITCNVYSASCYSGIWFPK
jgi:hypothetical protein